MVFKVNKKYFGIRFSIGSFSSFAERVGLPYTFLDGKVAVPDDRVHDAISKGLKLCANCKDYTLSPSVPVLRPRIDDHLVILMAAVINSKKPIIFPEEKDTVEKIDCGYKKNQPCQR